MRMNALRSLHLAAAMVGLAAPLSTQEGHTLSGTWYGDFGTGNQRRDLTVVLKWDGRSVSGVINPGPAASPITAATMNITPGKPAPEGQDSTEGTPPVFHVRFEAQLPNGGGAAERVVFEGTIENPVAGNRRISGNWTRGSERGTFQIRRL